MLTPPTPLFFFCMAIPSSHFEAQHRCTQSAAAPVTSLGLKLGRPSHVAVLHDFPHQQAQAITCLPSPCFSSCAPCTCTTCVQVSRRSLWVMSGMRHPAEGLGYTYPRQLRGGRVGEVLTSLPPPPCFTARDSSKYSLRYTFCSTSVCWFSE